MSYPPYDPAAPDPNDPARQPGQYPPPGGQFPPPGGQFPPPGGPGYPQQPGSGQPPYAGYGQPGYQGYGQPGFPPPMPGQIPPNDPLISPDYGGWWRRGMAILKAGWRPIAALQLIYLVFALAFGVLVTVIGHRFRVQLADEVQATNPDIGKIFSGIAPLYGVAVLGGFVITVVLYLVVIASVRVVVTIGTGRPVSLGAAIGGASQRLFPMIGWAIVAGLIYMVSLLLCVLPILYTATALAVLPVVVAVERTNAIGRSFSLFHGAFGPALARILTIGGIAVGVLFLFALISGIAGAAMGTVPAGARPGTTAIVPLGVEITFSVIQSVLIAGLSVVLVPLWVLTYADLRARKEPTTSDTIRADLGIA